MAVTDFVRGGTGKRELGSTAKRGRRWASLMPISEYIRGLRKHVGHDLLMLPGVSAVVLNHAGEVLLGRRSDNGQWSLIAGSIDPGEQPADTIIREIYEEAGVRAVIERLAGVALHPVTPTITVTSVST